MSEVGIEIENLAAFRRDLKAAADASPRELSAALREAGKPVLERVKQVAAVGRPPKDKHPGLLRGSYRIRVRTTSAFLASTAPYGAGAEWGLHGNWKGFRKYPAYGTGRAAGRGRFAWRAVVEKEDEIFEVMTKRLQDIITIHGWARE